MTDTSPLAVPSELAPYNTYVEDPKWQLKYTYIWVSLISASVVVSIPSLIQSIRRRRATADLLGIREDWGSSYKGLVVADTGGPPPRKHVRIRPFAILSGFSSLAYWTLPGIELNTGQIFAILAYLVIVLVCVIVNAPLMSNPNRAGFLAVAQLPPTFLFATKNSVLSFLLGPGHGYEKLNYSHRWSARGLFLAALVHGVLWIRNHLVWDIPILGQQKETSGVAAFGVLCVIMLTSWRGVRRLSWQFFWIVHILAFPAFFITICYHTLYAVPWIFPPLAFYGLDLLLRMFKYRVKDAFLSAVDNQMTIISIPDCCFGWLAGQHVRLRVFFDGRVFESHPLTIMSAPASISCLGDEERGPGIILGARVKGDWTAALNKFTSHEQDLLQSALQLEKPAGHPAPPVPVNVLIDGPYGGCSLDLGQYETVLLFAGGSGATFTIGLLDEIIGRCIRGRSCSEITKRIEFSWCIRGFGAIQWFTPHLLQIANAASQCESIDLHISIYVTCLCDPEAVPPIPNCDVTIIRPAIHKVIQALLTPPCARSPAKSSIDDDVLTPTPDADLEAEIARNISEKLMWVGVGGGVAICAAGPESLTREASNAGARIQMRNSLNGGELGDVGLHTELFSV